MIKYLIKNVNILMKKYLIKNVNIIPISTETILENQDVLIIGDRIAKIAPHLEEEDVIHIDATGKYLLPGITDMHVHIEDENTLRLLVANGVTTIRNMWGAPLHLAWKNQIANGKLISPYMYTTNPLTDGSPPIWNGSYIVTNQTEAKQCVQEAIEAGYDQIKVYNLLTKDAYDALVKEAKEAGIKITGHIPDEVGLQHALEQSQYCNEHLTGYMAASMSETAKTNCPERINKAEYLEYLLEHFDGEQMKRLVEKTKKQGVWNCPTFVVNKRIGRPSKTEEFLQEDAMKYVSKTLLKMWNPKTDFRVKNVDQKMEDNMEKLFDRYLLLGAELKAQGAHLLFGTDTPNPFVVPGFSIHEEFQYFSKVGFSNYEILKIATLTAADFMESDDFGSITEGKRADLVLVDNNPLEDLTHLKHPYGVFLRGQWLDRSYIDEMLSEIEEMYAFENRWFHDLNPEELGDDYVTYHVVNDGILTQKSRMQIGDTQILLHTSDGLSEKQIRCLVNLEKGKPVAYDMTLFLNSLKTELKVNQNRVENQWDVEFSTFAGEIEKTSLPADIPVGFLDIINFLLLPKTVYQLQEGESVTFEQNTLDVYMPPLVRKASIFAKQHGEIIELKYKSKNKELSYRLWCVDDRTLRKLEIDDQFGLSTISLVEK